MIRYSPMAEVKVLSLVALIEKLTGQTPGTTPDDNFEQAAQTLLQNISAEYGSLHHFLARMARSSQNATDNMFATIGTATNVRISEDYGTRAVFGIGEPTDPVLVPNNMNVRVSISKLSIDKTAISRYAMKPVYWYNHVLQRKALDAMISLNADLIGADYFFYTYLVMKDLEKSNDAAYENGGEYVETIDTDYILAFMPNDFATSYSNTTTLIETNVNGTGKALRISEIVKVLADRLG